MSFFDDDPFEEIIREFFGASPSMIQRQKQFTSRETDYRNIDFIETDDLVYFIFEFPGLNKEDLNIEIDKNRIRITVQKIKGSSQDYLSRKLRSGKIIEKILPKIVNPKKPKITFENGVLEVSFIKNEKR